MIEVCIGSACHLKGSYEIIQQLKALLEAHDLVAKVELKSAFCLGACGSGVSIRLNNNTIYSISPEETESFFKTHILEA